LIQRIESVFVWVGFSQFGDSDACALLFRFQCALNGDYQTVHRLIHFLIPYRAAMIPLQLGGIDIELHGCFFAGGGGGGGVGGGGATGRAGGG
jgi:hypothetical protein